MSSFWKAENYLRRLHRNYFISVCRVSQKKSIQSIKFWKNVEKKRSGQDFSNITSWDTFKSIIQVSKDLVVKVKFYDPLHKINQRSKWTAICISDVIIPVHAHWWIFPISEKPPSFSSNKMFISSLNTTVTINCVRRSQKWTQSSLFSSVDHLCERLGKAVHEISRDEIRLPQMA